jgi:cbb3-type cytochrome oxidase maturation protein
MTALAWLIPAALGLGLIGLAAFLWALRHEQFEDLEGAAWRALEDEGPNDVADNRRDAGSAAANLSMADNLEKKP